MLTEKKLSQSCIRLDAGRDVYDAADGGSEGDEDDFNQMGNGTDDNEDNDYVVEKIVAHSTFDECVLRAQLGEINFDPRSLHDEETTHSKFVYFIKWKDYDTIENTWEPEENLLNLGLLEDYKVMHNIPHVDGMFATFEKFYTADIVRKVSLAHEAFCAEIERKKLKMNQNKRRRSKSVQNKREKEEREQHQQPQQQRKSETSYKIPKKKNKELSPDAVDENNPATEAPPTMVAAAGAMPQKRKIADDGEGEAPIGMIERKQARMEAGEEMVEEEEVGSGSEEDEDEDEEEEEEESEEDEEESEEEDSEEVDDEDDQEEDLTPEEEEEVKALMMEEEAEDRERQGEEERAQTPNIIECPLPHRNHMIALDLSMKRKWRSAEQLNERFEEAAHVEMLNQIHFVADAAREGEQSLEIQLINGIDELRIDNEQNREMYKKKLIDYNWSIVYKTAQKFQLDENMTLLFENLVHAYTLDWHEEFIEQFEVLKDAGPTIKLFFIEVLVKTCRTVSSYFAHRAWKNREKVRRPSEKDFVVTDEDVSLYNEPLILEVCSEDHVKCQWLKIFLEILPPSRRFSIYGVLDTEETGPFRDDVFMHCMKYGADCQKFQFLRYNVPFGNLEEEMDGDCVDHAHIVAVQGKSLHRMCQFIKNGFDINALAKKRGTQEVLTLVEYIDEWTARLEEKLENEEGPKRDVDMDYYESLTQMLVVAASNMDELVFSEICKHIIIPSMNMCKIQFRLTLPHILHCSPVNNKEAGGTGENQVLSCLYMAMGCRSPDGKYQEEHELADARFQKLFKTIQDKVFRNRGRLVLVVYRVEIQVGEVPIPQMTIVESDEGLEIERMTILRQTVGLSPEEADLAMVELTDISTPGRRVFGFDSRELEARRLVPGMAHIEMRGSVKEPMNFLVQVVFLENNNLLLEEEEETEEEETEDEDD